MRNILAENARHPGEMTMAAVAAAKAWLAQWNIDHALEREDRRQAQSGTNQGTMTLAPWLRLKESA
jgi:hypothetical protein